MFNILSMALLAIGVIFFILFLFSLTRHRSRISVPFAFMCLVTAIYVFGFGLELRAETLEDIQFALKLQLFGSPFIGPLFLIFTYCFHYKVNPPISIIVLLLLPALALQFLSMTNEYHSLVFKSYLLHQYDGHLLAETAKGLWYYLITVYAAVALVVCTLVFFTAWEKVHFSINSQAFFLLIGAISPGIAHIITEMGYTPLNLDFTPMAFVITCIFFDIAVFRYGFLQMNDDMIDVIYSQSQEGILVIDNKNRLVSYNKSSGLIYTWLNMNTIGSDISLFQEGRTLLEQQADLFELEIQHVGETNCYEFRRNELKENNDTIAYVYHISNVTERNEMLNKLNEMANIDMLTGIYNRRHFTHQAELELKRAARYDRTLSLLIIDLDYFKLINDNYGHLAGDEVLKTLVKTCQTRLRSTDIFGRYGGDEFLILLPETPLEVAVHLAEEIRETIARLEVDYHGHMIHLTVSIGVANNDGCIDENCLKGMITKADENLYLAKNNVSGMTPKKWTAWNDPQKVDSQIFANFGDGKGWNG